MNVRNLQPPARVLCLNCHVHMFLCMYMSLYMYVTMTLLMSKPTRAPMSKLQPP